MLKERTRFCLKRWYVKIHLFLLSASNLPVRGCEKYRLMNEKLTSEEYTSAFLSPANSPRGAARGAHIPLSLNVAVRKREYMKIMEENISILERIEKRRPVYSHKRWARERRQTEGYISNMKKYVYVTLRFTIWISFCFYVRGPLLTR